MLQRDTMKITITRADDTCDEPRTRFFEPARRFTRERAKKSAAFIPVGNKDARYNACEKKSIN